MSVSPEPTELSVWRTQIEERMLPVLGPRKTEILTQGLLLVHSSIGLMTLAGHPGISQARRLEMVQGQLALIYSKLWGVLALATAPDSLGELDAGTPEFAEAAEAQHEFLKRELMTLTDTMNSIVDGASKIIIPGAQ